MKKIGLLLMGFAFLVSCASPGQSPGQSQERPGNAVERLVPYDDFNATQIDPDKWFGESLGQNPEVLAMRPSGRSRTTGCTWSTAPMAGRTPTAGGPATHSS
jgi:hypothetical protein